MHIAVLATNTDDSDFAARHPRDVEKFRVLMQGVRPGWQVTAFDLPKGQFPEDIQGFDGGNGLRRYGRGGSQRRRGRRRCVC